MQSLRKTLLLTVVLLASSIPFAQSIKIGSIEIFGNRKIGSDIILSRLSIKQGDRISDEDFKPENVVAATEHIPGVKHATVTPVCCDPANHMLLYVGIGETDSVILKHRPAPKQNIKLSDDMIIAYRNLDKQRESAVRSGQATEDDSQGYALFDYPPARNVQIRYLDFA